MRSLMLLAVLLGTAQPIWSQESGRALVSAGRKRLQDARGKQGKERNAVLEDALRILRMVPEKFPKEGAAVARAWLESGRILRRLGRVEEAQGALERVLEVEGEARPACDALHELATLYTRARKRDKATAALQRIVSEHPQQGMSRARALIRLASLQRRAKQVSAAEELLRRCLKEHGDLWRPSIDALDALVSLKIKSKDLKQARSLLASHGEAIAARFADSPVEGRVRRALQKMKSRGRLEKLAAGSGKGRDR